MTVARALLTVTLLARFPGWSDVCCHANSRWVQHMRRTLWGQIQPGHMQAASLMTLSSNTNTNLGLGKQ